jgi:hypothetical protein
MQLTQDEDLILGRCSKFRVPSNSSMHLLITSVGGTILLNEFGIIL